MGFPADCCLRDDYSKKERPCALRTHMSRQPTGTRNTRPFSHEGAFGRRSAAGALACLLLLSAPATAASGATGNLDPAFARLPFNQWVSQGKQSQIRWSVEILPAE